ncbi:hypothetical protein AXF15_11600 [Desulfomicrobium orale DSM 12838]|uniref:Uncharacterized protein n=1 Tax=Desulfomicrobium orale DSM 12838 TaxID=888061 RepID=A0A120KNB9_9BACT|nr:hypothetical protein AXF15_11600 [Desulfomicrobium orale DSM 12838]
MNIFPGAARVFGDEIFKKRRGCQKVFQARPKTGTSGFAYRRPCQKASPACSARPDLLGRRHAERGSFLG